MPELGIDYKEHEDVPMTDGERVKYVNHLYEQSKEYKKNYKAHITLNNLRWYKGEHYEKDQQIDSKEYVVSNRIFAVIESMLPIMTDNRPKFNYYATEPNDQPATDMMNKVVGEYLWSAMDMDMKLPENGKQVLIYGTGFMQPYWDNEALNGLGDIKVKVLSPFSVFPCPGYTEINNKIPYYIFADRVPVEDIKKRYKLGYLVKPDGAEDDEIPDPGKDTNKAQEGISQVTDTTGAVTDYLPMTSHYGKRDERKALLKECYIKPNPEEPQFPKGKIITIANNVFLEERPIQIEYAQIVKFIDMVMPGEFWGMGEVLQLRDPQKMINKFKSVIVNMLRIASDPPLLCDTGAIDDDSVENWINEPGIIIEKMAGSDVSWMQMQLPNQGLIQYIQESEKEVSLISGSQEWTPSSSGALPSGQSLYQMQEIGQTRLRLKIRNMKSSLEKLGILVAKYFLEYYTEPRIMRISGEDGSPQYIKTFREDNPQMAEVMSQIIAQEGLIPLNLAQINPDFDLKVSVEPAMPLDKSSKLQIATQLLEMGAIDTQAVLDAIDYPDKEKIQARMQEAAAQAQQQQMEMMKQKEMLDAKVKTAPKISLSGKVEDL